MRQPDLKSQSCLLFPAYLPWCPWIYRDLNDESFPSDLGSLSLLQDLDLSGNNFVNPPAQCIINLSMLQNLSFNDCPRLKSLPMLPPNLQGFGEQTQLQLIYFVENCSKSCKATIKKCGCRVTCKEKLKNDASTQMALLYQD
ncbi:hypothetical protein JHK87_038784 [Glycine soja]|nr:hypothetical protein JHK87_038784 [Glycine soja]